MSKVAQTALVAVAICVPVALLIAAVAGAQYGAQRTRLALAARSTQTPLIVVRTRPVVRLVVATPTAVVYATPVPSASPVPTVPPDGPQHPISGATYCTSEKVCVTLSGYTLDPELAGVGAQDLDCWFHVENRSNTDNGVDDSQFTAGVKGGFVLNAEPLPGQSAGMPDGVGANTELVASGHLDGLITFLVPSSSHEVNVRLIPPFSVINDQTPYGSWTISY